MRALRRFADAVGRLRAALGTPGLMIGLFSLLSFAFGLMVLVRQYNRPREIGRVTLHQVIGGWVRIPGYLGTTLIDDVDRWRHASAQDEPRRRAELVKVFAQLGDELDHQSERFPLLRIVSMELLPRGGRPLARWDGPTASLSSRADVLDRIALLPPGDGPAIDLLVRYRIDPDVVREAAGLETSYHRLFLAVVGLSGFSLICLGYMVLHAKALSARAAREAAQEATLDLADRTCHELGNGVFILSNERRNLADHLDLVDRFVSQEAEARASAARRAGLDPDALARWNDALEHEYAARGIAPGHELRGSAAIAREVCRQIAVCSEYIALTVRELDGFLKRSELPVELGQVAVADCFEEALALLQPAIESSGSEVERRLPDDLLVKADRRLLVHALVNLLKNALEAASGLRETPRVRLEARVEGSAAWLVVADNGPGIAEDDLHRIFDAGYTTKAASRGRGLAIVRESVHVQGGVIDVSSRPGEGAEFRIGLPVATRPEPATHQVES
jgi:signal transduction histidine kinase